MDSQRIGGRVEPITVLILAKDEEANIGRAVASVGGLHRVLVLDSGSRDRTSSIARELGAEVVSTDWPGFAAQRRRAIGMAETEWAMFLDADESLDKELQKSLRSFSPPPGIDGFYLRRRNHFLGKPMEHARWENDWQLRLFRCGSAEIPEVQVHEGVQVSGKTGRLNAGCIEHYTAPSIRRYLEKMNAYSSLEAAQKHASGRRVSPAKMVFDLLSELWKVYIIHQGWREGWRGYAMAHMAALYKFSTGAKLWEARRAR